jgi:glycosyltransferase involved in cell wall biosynthesis
MTTISIVTPCYNEAQGIVACYEAVRLVIESELQDMEYEHIFIDNCSSDGTVQKLREIAARDLRVKVIVNARNFGPARSPFHAFLQTKGDAVVPVVADLQTPPALIPDMVKLWRTGAKAVIAVRRRGAERGLMPIARSLFYRLMTVLSQVEQIPQYMVYGLYDRCIVEAMRGLNEPEPYFRGLVMEVGFERAFIEYDQPPRRHGRSSYNLMSLTDYALVGLFTHSRAPLRLMTFIGIIGAAASFLIGVVYLILKLIFWQQFPAGVTPVLIVIFFLSAMQLFALGVVGEYIGLLLNYSRHFPIVIEKERINF